MSENKKDTVLIKKESLKITLDRSDLSEIKETPDGVIFNFKFGYSLVVVDNYMPLDYKGRIRAADTAFAKGSLVFDMNNRTNPVTIDLS